MERSLWRQAQRGQAQALEILINQALKPQGLRVRVQQRWRQLVIHCDSPARIPAQGWTRFIQRGLGRLQYQSRQPVWLDGGDWQVVVNLGVRVPPSPTWLPYALGLVGAGSLVLGGWLAYQWQPPATIAQDVPETKITPAATPLPTPTVITIKAVGDVILGSNFPDNRLHPQPRQLLQQVQADLGGADVVFGNLETTITDHPYSSKNVNGRSVFAFRMPPSYAQILRSAGFTIFSLANNHSGDFGDIGLRDTARHLQNAGMPSFGKRGEIFYQTVRGVRLAWIGFSPYDYHNSVLELTTAQKLVQQARTQADLVIISSHMGAEGTGALRTRNQNEVFFGEDRGNPIQFSRRMIDSGADLVLGHGPHVPRAIEVYRGKLIAYSLGNFIGYRTLGSQAELGYSLILETQLAADGSLMGARVIPVIIQGEGIPVPDRQNRTIKLIQELNRLDTPGSTWVLGNDGVMRPRN
ncbi:Capsule synthesis protein, CapA [Gloeomargarita lithophora Alchichica-D10]|uniref:Capsule synthesis protein, CapA n=1 Tax=Gloeomargarita lithophora Alchichica-D10 TaxID=1188229 RepID=A0A1J0AH63_9CYAN|nr:CapA family protein [Gloeomargarita lithophora]APB35235.1 Capsule synthesis protein, CapA [Gloeomargarita lithophora Alchichica-D10]